MSQSPIKFECESRITAVDAYIPGAIGLLPLGGGIALFVKSAPPWVLLIGLVPALLLFGLAIHLYRRRGTVTFRVVGDETEFVMMSKWEDVTIRLRQLTQVAYDDRGDGPPRTAFHLANGCVEYLGMHLVDHGPLLAYIRGSFSGEMTYNGRTITTPEEIPRRAPRKRSKPRVAHRRSKSRRPRGRSDTDR